MKSPCLTIIGGGLAGSEAAWQAASRGIPVTLYEMRPNRSTPAHQTADLAELVCSNSLRSNDPHSAVGLLKEEMRQLGSLVMDAALETQVPAGKALAVDREKFAEAITRQLEKHPLITIQRQEILRLPSDTWPSQCPCIVASGPLTSAALTESLVELTGREHLAFYDAIAPIVSAESLDRSIIYQASRYDDGPGDYLNCPFTEEQFKTFANALLAAEKVPLKAFEDPKYFEGCLPIEVMFERGEDTPRFGPMKPVGLPDPRTGKDPYAVVQLRWEDKEGTRLNMVGFQTKLTYKEQRRIFSLIPGMENADFLRLGSIHRNTFICAPEVLLPTLQTKTRPSLFLAGQLSGVEGYVESTAMGLLAGINGARMAKGEELVTPPPETAHGALISHLTTSEPKHFQPSNINFGLFPVLKQKLRKRYRGEFRARTALEKLNEWVHHANICQNTNL